MKRYVSILLLTVYLFSFPEAKQFLKIGNFIEHYQDHCQRNPHTTVFSFIVLHYFSGDVKDGDYEEDMKLPFKKNDLGCSISFAISLPEYFEIDLKPVHTFQFRNSDFVYTTHFTSQELDTLWQPPEII